MTDGAGTMTQPTKNTSILRIACRTLTARNVRRELECVEGPCDGDRKVLEAGECSIDLPSGRYVAVACIVNGASNEHLQWVTD